MRQTGAGSRTRLRILQLRGDSRTEGSRAGRDWRRPGSAGALLGLLVAILLVGGVPAVHSHDGPGLYDQQCLLSCLAAGTPTLPSSRVAAPAKHVPIPYPVPAVVVLGPAERTLASFDSRASSVDLPLRFAH